MIDQFNQALHNLKEFWGYDSFREGQNDAIQSVFSKKDTLILFPTGGGKSLCYQVPATVFDGLTLVISPLVALMQDQVQQLNDQGVSATFLNNTIPGYEVEQRLVNARNGMYKLLYCSPERLGTMLFQNELRNLNIDLVAIDEAHCISEWGHDFRPAYRQIKEKLNVLSGSASWIALTATATPEVRKDILDSLGFDDPEIISLGFTRPNLTWWVVETEQTRQKMIDGVTKASQKGDGLIYGGTRKNCEYWAGFFSKKGIKSEPYHAGIESEIRKKIQEKWIVGETPLVVATNAFGMGIDKPDCRYVVHQTMPYSLEAYYQEAGRAGRDGEEAFPILYYKPSDFKAAQNRIQQNYPTRKQLENVYKALCDSFELAVGAEMPEARKIDLESVVKRSNESQSICKASLRLMEQFGIIAWQQSVKPGYAMQFTLSREMLQKFKEQCNNTEKAEFVDKLERLLTPQAFYNVVEVELEYLMKCLDVSKNGLTKALNVLMQNDYVLVFNEIEERDLVKILETRASKLPVRKDEVERHRKVLLKKLEKMNEFVISDTCREVFLRNYFGDTGAKPCGHCDNCLKTGSESFSTGFNDEDAKNAMRAFAGKELAISDLATTLRIHESKAKAIVSYLVRENRITMSERSNELYSAVESTSIPEESGSSN